MKSTRSVLAESEVRSTRQTVGIYDNRPYLPVWSPSGVAGIYVQIQDSLHYVNTLTAVFSADTDVFNALMALV